MIRVTAPAFTCQYLPQHSVVSTEIIRGLRLVFVYVGTWEGCSKFPVRHIPTVAFLREKLEEDINRCSMLSETTIVSPLGFFIFATQRMTKTRVKALTTMYERKFSAQKLKGEKNCISFPWFRILSYSDFKAEAQRCGVDLQHSRWASSSSSYCYGEGYQPGGQCRNASAETLDANWEDLKNAEFELYIPSDISYSTCLSYVASDSCLCK